MIAPVVQWIELARPKGLIGVRFLSGALNACLPGILVLFLLAFYLWITIIGRPYNVWQERGDLWENN